MLLTDAELIARNRKNTIIAPFVPFKVSTDVISYGVSHAGYDLRLAPVFKVMTPWTIFKARVRAALRGKRLVIDPKKPDPRLYRTFYGQYFDIPPRSVVLGVSLEWIGIPDDCIAINIGKSTYARNNVHANVTPAEPGWRGYLTIELHNQERVPVRVYAHEGIIQMVFICADKNVEAPYEGKYQDQGKEPTLGYVR